MTPTDPRHMTERHLDELPNEGMAARSSKILSCTTLNSSPQEMRRVAAAAGLCLGDAGSPQPFSSCQAEQLDISPYRALVYPSSDVQVCHYYSPLYGVLMTSIFHPTACPTSSANHVIQLPRALIIISPAKTILAFPTNSISAFFRKFNFF